MKFIISDCLKESIRAKEDFANREAENIIRLSENLVATIKNGGKLLVFGNGGSAADAQHIAAEFVNRFLIDRPPLPALALTTDTSILTSVGNDFSFEDVFAKQIAALGKKEDLALGISTSGNSPNVLKAIDVAKKMGLQTAALTGGNGGKLGAMADIVLNVPTDQTPHIQEVHLWVEHLLCQLVDTMLFGDSKNTDH